MKGDGVQSLAALAMMQHYSREIARAREFILAVEEPEAHLHPSAIHALRNVLRETAETQQVVVTTHSPLFVNRLDLQSNIIVRKNRATPARSVQELREVLGVQASDNLENAEVILIVEGEDDEASMRALLPLGGPKLLTALEAGVLTVMPLYGAGNMNYLLTQLRDSLAAVHAFVDDDEAGRVALTAAQGEGLLTVADSTSAMCSGAAESEFEDLVDPVMYRGAFQTEFNVEVDHPWTRHLSKGKWSKRMAVVFQANGVRLTHALLIQAKAVVSRCVVAQPEAAIKVDCEGVIGAVRNALETKLEARQA